MTEWEGEQQTQTDIQMQTADIAPEKETTKKNIKLKIKGNTTMRGVWGPDCEQGRQLRVNEKFDKRFFCSSSNENYENCNGEE